MGSIISPYGGSSFFTNIFLTFVNFCTMFFSAIFGPLINVLVGFFPGLDIIVNYVIDFVDKGLSCVPLILNLVCVPRDIVAFLFSYYISLFAIYLLMRSARSILSIINVMKLNFVNKKFLNRYFKG